jgi:alkanesulfonate monooxygenase SsuD/methylene tetrahydromethanopterin reductase-like flavin-dependent oxidoreductase (luciferase family)
MTLVRNVSIFVAANQSNAVEQATQAFNAGGIRGTLEDFLKTAVIGTPEQCVERLREMESWGINYVRAAFTDARHQESVARLVLPLLEEVRV